MRLRYVFGVENVHIDDVDFALDAGIGTMPYAQFLRRDRSRKK